MEPVPPLARPTAAIGDQLVDEVWLRSRASLPIAVVGLMIAWPLVRGTAMGSRAGLAAYLSLIGIGVIRCE